MSIDKGPSPEEIIESIKLEESQRTRGHLKIYLGMAPGVGKTYAMLEEAHHLLKEHIDVVVGNIEAHEREEIAILLKNLPEVPKKTTVYKDKEFSELDIDAIIRLKPGIVLVDELAHSNLPGSKHEKRWQDVQEILEHGISVHTTLNVQHIDSLRDVVLSITEIAISETVPDAMIERAHSIQLIDLTPDELLQRLDEGKVFTEGQIKVAGMHFFQKNRLSALREVVLRYVADKIDLNLMCMVTTKEGRVEWRTREKFLVAISQNARSHKLLKAGRRLASQANAPWFAVYVDTGKPLEKEEEETIEKLEELTRSMGAELIKINDPDIAEGIKRIAYQRNITQIILGRTPRNLVVSLLRGPTLVDKLSAECKTVDLHVIRQDQHPLSKSKKWSSSLWQSKVSDYFFAALSVGLMASLSWVALFFAGYRVVELLFFIAVCALNVFFGPGPVIFAAILFGLIWGFVFTPPPVESIFSPTDDLFLLVLYVLAAITIGVIAGRTRKHKELLRKGHKHDSQLSELLTCLHGDHALQDVLIALEEGLPKLLDGRYKFVVKKSNGLLDTEIISALVGNKESMTASWAFQNSHKAGWSTDTLPLSENLFIPLRGEHETMGLLIYKSPSGKSSLTKEEQSLLDNVCRQFAGYLEKAVKSH